MTSPHFPAFKFCTLPHHPCIGIFCIYCSLFLVFPSLLLIVFPVTYRGSIGQRVSVVTSPRPSGFCIMYVHFTKAAAYASYKARVNRDGEMVCLLDS